MSRRSKRKPRSAHHAPPFPTTSTAPSGSNKCAKPGSASWPNSATWTKKPYPDTVTINDDGSYALDVKGLLEKDPIVVHKDGAYLIHLPSLFDGKK